MPGNLNTSQVENMLYLKTYCCIEEDTILIQSIVKI